jgi:hypothetical protein
MGRRLPVIPSFIAINNAHVLISRIRIIHIVIVLLKIVILKLQVSRISKPNKLQLLYKIHNVK